MPHTLTDRDEETRLAVCSVCGPGTPMWKKGSRNGRMRWRCGKLTYSRQKTYLSQLRPRPPEGQTCAICGKGGLMFWDHDHTTGEFRGWLCRHCNWLLGHAYDNVGTLASAIQYLNASDNPGLSPITKERQTNSDKPQNQPAFRHQ